MLKKTLFVVLIMLLCAGASFAAHPLITDEAETLDKGEVEVEINAEYSMDKNYVEDVKIEEFETEFAAKVIYGIVDNVELELEVPYQWVREKEDGVETFKANGMGDVGIEVKWRFYNEDDLSFALKPSLSFPTGDSDKELGTGKIGYGLMFLTSKEIDAYRLAFHLNVGIMHSEYKNEEEKEETRSNIWHVSLAAEKGIAKDWKVVANVGMEENPDKSSNTNPAFALGGVIYSVTKKFDIDLGAKFGLTKTEPDLAILAGMIWKF